MQWKDTVELLQFLFETKKDNNLVSLMDKIYFQIFILDKMLAYSQPITPAP